MDQESDRNSELCNRLLCRLCFKVDVVHLNIFGEICRVKQVAMKLTTCLSLKVSENDKLPQNICLLCFLTLEASYELRDKALTSDKMLQEVLYSNQNQNFKSDGNSEFCTRLLCRLCLKVDVVHLNIFGQICREKQIAMKLTAFISLKLSENDKLPQNICLFCFLTLEASCELRDKALTSDKTLRDVLYSTQNQLQKTNAPVPGASAGQKKIKIPCGANISEFGISNIGTHNSVPVKLPLAADKENTPFQFTTPQVVKKIETVQHPEKNKFLHETGKKVKTKNKLLNVESQKQEQSVIVNNETSLPQTPRSNQFQGDVQSPSPMSSAMKRKRPREQLAENINSKIRAESQSHADSSKLLNQFSAPTTPRRTATPRNPKVMPSLADTDYVLCKRSKEVTQEKPLSTYSHIVDQKPRLPLAEKCTSIENSSKKNMETTIASSQEKKLLNNYPVEISTEKIAFNGSTTKEIEREASRQYTLERDSKPIKPNNVLEPCKENMGNSIAKSKRETLNKFIDQCQAEIRSNTTPRKLCDADELAKNLQYNKIKKKQFEKDRPKIANKADLDIFKFTEIEETVQQYKPAKRSGKRQYIADLSEPRTQTTFQNIDTDAGKEKKSEQGKSLSPNVHREPSPSMNEALDSSFGTILKEIPSSQSDEPEIPEKPKRKSLPVDIRDSWKKSQGEWPSEQISNGSEDANIASNYGACLATGDVFGASIARKMDNSNARNDNLDVSSMQKTYNEKIQGTPKGKRSPLLPSLLLTSSSPDDPLKNSTSSLNMSSLEEERPIYKTRSTTLRKNIGPKTAAVSPKDIEAKKVTVKPPKKTFPLLSQAVDTKTSALTVDCLSDYSSDYHLTPEFKKTG